MLPFQHGYKVGNPPFTSCNVQVLFMHQDPCSPKGTRTTGLSRKPWGNQQMEAWFGGIVLMAFVKPRAFACSFPGTCLLVICVFVLCCMLVLLIVVFVLYLCSVHLLVICASSVHLTVSCHCVWICSTYPDFACRSCLIVCVWCVCRFCSFDLCCACW